MLISTVKYVNFVFHCVLHLLFKFGCICPFPWDHGHSPKTPCFQSEWGIAGMQPQLQQEIMFKRDILHAYPDLGVCDSVGCVFQLTSGFGALFVKTDLISDL
jgi:hypothetical protein